MDVLEWLQADRFSVLNLLVFIGGWQLWSYWRAWRRSRDGWKRYTVDVRVEQVDL